MSYPGVADDEMVSVPRHMVKEAQTAKDETVPYEQVDEPIAAQVPTENRAARRKKLGASKRDGKKTIEIECPSGDDCLVKNIDMEDLMEAGLLGELDIFSKKLFPNKLDPAGRPIEQNEDEAEESFWTIMADTTKREAFMEMAEKIVCLGVVDPIVRPRDWEPELTDDEISFNDIVLNDKLYLFNYLMGPINAISSFR